MPLTAEVGVDAAISVPPTARVLVAGEALTDIIRRGNSVEEHPGGSPANVALGLARLGTPTSFLTALGRDQRGATINSRLSDAGVEVLPESWTLPVTSSASALIRPDGSAEYVFDIVWRLPEKAQLPLVQHVHIGSISAFLNPGADQIEQLVHSLDRSVTVSIDPNVRADLVGDPAAARARFERLAKRADVIKLSDEDADFLYPGTSPEDVAGAAAKQGALVAVTKGAAGSLLASGVKMVEIQPIPVQVADTVGAGDSYMAALLHWLLESDYPHLRPATEVQLLTTGSFAARAAAITVARSGAEPPTTLELARHS